MSWFRMLRWLGTHSAFGTYVGWVISAIKDVVFFVTFNLAT
jgi:hypothetical protein